MEKPKNNYDFYTLFGIMERFNLQGDEARALLDVLTAYGQKTPKYTLTLEQALELLSSKPKIAKRLRYVKSLDHLVTRENLTKDTYKKPAKKQKIHGADSSGNNSLKKRFHHLPSEQFETGMKGIKGKIQM